MPSRCPQDREAMLYCECHVSSVHPHWPPSLCPSSCYIQGYPSPYTVWGYRQFPVSSNMKISFLDLFVVFWRGRERNLCPILLKLGMSIEDGWKKRLLCASVPQRFQFSKSAVGRSNVLIHVSALAALLPEGRDNCSDGGPKTAGWFPPRWLF